MVSPLESLLTISTSMSKGELKIYHIHNQTPDHQSLSQTCFIWKPSPSHSWWQHLFSSYSAKNLFLVSHIQSIRKSFRLYLKIIQNLIAPVLIQNPTFSHLDYSKSFLTSGQSLLQPTGDPWTTQVWMAQIQLHADFVFNKYIQSHKCIFFSL